MVSLDRSGVMSAGDFKRQKEGTMAEPDAAAADNVIHVGSLWMMPAMSLPSLLDVEWLLCW